MLQKYSDLQMFNDFVARLEKLESGEIPEKNMTAAETEEMVNIIKSKITCKGYEKLFPVIRQQIERAIDDGYRL